MQTKRNQRGYTWQYDVTENMRRIQEVTKYKGKFYRKGRRGITNMELDEGKKGNRLLIRTHSPLEVTHFETEIENTRRSTNTVTNTSLAHFARHAAVTHALSYSPAASSAYSLFTGRRVVLPRSEMTAARACPSGPCSSAVIRASGHRPRGPSSRTSTTSPMPGRRLGRPRGEVLQHRRALRYSEVHRRLR